MNKRFNLILLLFFTVHTIPCSSISPSELKKFTTWWPIAMTVEGPIVWDVCRYLFEGKKDWKTVKDPKSWLKCAAVGVVSGGLIYYALKKYTPHAKFSWARGVKNAVEADLLILGCRPTSNGQKKYEILNSIKHEISKSNSSRPCMSMVHRLYVQAQKLDSAISWLVDAPSDIPDDNDFQQDCENLIKEIKNVISDIKEYAKLFICTEHWFEELWGCSSNAALEQSRRIKGCIPTYYIHSLKWSIDLIGGFAILINHQSLYSFNKITFPLSYFDNIQDWSDESKDD